MFNMFCCAPLESTSSPEAAANDVETIVVQDEKTFSLLSEDDDDDDEVAAAAAALVARRKEALEQSNNNKEQTVSVKIPQGVRAGQNLTVRSPDGIHSTIAAVPAGMTPGQTFLVKIPVDDTPSVTSSVFTTPKQQKQQPTETAAEARTQPQQQERGMVEGATAAAATADPQPESRDAATEQREEEQEEEEQQQDSVKHTPSLVEVIEDWITPKPYAPVKSIVVPNDNNDTATAVSKEEEEEETPVQQKLLLVQVPPGLPSGTTIHVEIPGEFRTVAAKVPPAVRSFHVAYTPLQQQQQQQQKVRSVLPTLPPPQQASSTIVQPKHQTGPKLLRVRIPTGTTAGTTLHVTVPDEPGRILAAVVPEGATGEFHVSYAPVVETTKRSMLPPANAYKLPQEPPAADAL